MSNGTSLMNLKMNAKAARANVLSHEKKREPLYDTAVILGIVLCALGVVALMVGLGFLNASSALGKEPTVGFCFIAGAITLGLIGTLGVRLPSILRSRDKELAELKAEEVNTREGYRLSLVSEASTYGINTSTMRNRSDVMDSDYEFTALRGDVPIDVTIRDFRDEIVFMLNGERMQKPVSV